MLLYTTRTAVFKNGDKSVLLCKVTLPCGSDDEQISGVIAEFYSEIYRSTYASAREYALRIEPPGGRLATLTVNCTHDIKKEVLTVSRSYIVSHLGRIIKERVFIDKFSKNMIKQRNIP